MKKIIILIISATCLLLVSYIGIFNLSLFNNFYATGGSAIPNSTSISHKNNLLVAGDYSGIVSFYTNLSTIINAKGVQYGGYIIKYNQANVPVWIKSVPGVRINAIVQDDAGNIYIGGAFSGNAYLDPDRVNTPTLSRNFGQFDGFIAKYDSTGRFTKARQFSGYSSEVTKLAFAWGQLYVGGFFFKQLKTVASKFYSVDDKDIFLCSYEAASLSPGMNGWEKQFSGPVADELHDLYYNKSQEKLIAAGNFTEQIKIDNQKLIGSSHEAGFVAIFQGSRLLSSFAITGSNSSTRMYSACLDNDKRIICTGSFAGTTNFNPASIMNYTSSTNSNGSPAVDMFVGIYEISGNPLKVNIYQSNGLAQGKVVRPDNQNNIIVFGNFDSNLIYNKSKIAINATRSLDLFLMSLDKQGNFMDIKIAGGSKDDIAKTMAVSHNLPRVAVGSLIYSPAITAFNNKQQNTNNYYVSIYNE